MNEILKAFDTQCIVVWALILRETKTIFGDSRLGYLWLIIQTAFLIATFWFLQTIFHMKPPHGIALPVFLLTGISIYFMFANIVSACMFAIEGNKALLTYPQVFTLDLIIARAVLIWATHIIVALILFTFAFFFSYKIEVVNTSKLVISLFLTLFLSLGAGTLVSSLNLLWPTTHTIIPMILRVLFFTSGVFYSVSRVVKYGGNFLLYNPLLHLILICRESLSDTHEDVDGSISYVIIFTIVLSVFGMLLERYTRKLRSFES
ncbi:MAG: ABC transporter permease [Deltaproteobacteria bacterium]|nr:ABC transporter permease [Deltaproteobacteria bacterium]